MTNENTALVTELTKSILEHLWRRDPELLLKYIDEDFTLTDSLHQFLARGQEEVYRFLPMVIEDTAKSRISDGEFLIAQNCGSACTIIGKYTLTPVDNISGMLQMRQHCVFVWEMTPNGELRLKYIGVSKPDNAPAPGDHVAAFCAAVPTSGAASDTNPAQPAAKPADRMIITDMDDCTRFISRSSILYVTSDGRNSQIHCLNGDISARLSISAFLDSAGSNFVLIHRCYAVNLDHITLLKPYCVVLSDGSELPIPVKRYSDVKQKLTELINK